MEVKQKQRGSNIIVSIIMPVYNTGALFFESYESILIQRVSDFELIVIDDGSQNDTFNIINNIAKTDDRIKLSRNQKNSGVSYSRNLAIEKAQGQYLAFLDCGDVWLDNKLLKQIEALKDSTVDLCFTGYQYFSNDTRIVEFSYRVPKNVSYKDMLIENYLGCSTVVVRRTSIHDYRFDANYFHEDYVLWLKMLKNNAKFVGLTDIYVNYRTGGRSANKVKAAINRWKVYRKAERLNLLVAVFYFIKYFFRMVVKYVFNKESNYHE